MNTRIHLLSSGHNHAKLALALPGQLPLAVIFSKSRLQTAWHSLMRTSYCFARQVNSPFTKPDISISRKIIAMLLPPEIMNCLFRQIRTLLSLKANGDFHGSEQPSERQRPV
jgi:hypothetical protein